MSSIPSTTFEKDIVEVLNAMMNVLETQHVRFSHLEGHVAELSKRASTIVVKVPKNRKLLTFALGVAAGVYVTKNISKIETFLENANEGAKKRFTSTDSQDATYTVKPNGASTVNSDAN